MTEGKIIGNRVPKDFFVTKGTGESDIAFYAGSFHIALKEAGIEAFNIMKYSSILPGIATEIKKPDNLVYGCVMECIMASADAKMGNRATAAIIYGWLYDKQTGERYGGLVCEYNGGLDEEAAGKQLRLNFDELYMNGFSEKYDLKDIRLISESFVPGKKFGTAVVAICFTSYVYPELG